MGNEVTPLGTKQIHERYGIRPWQIHRAYITGYIGPVRGPCVVKDGHYLSVSVLQMDMFAARRKDFDQTYLTAKRMSVFLSLRHGMKINTSTISRFANRVPYMNVVPPKTYSFDGGGSYYYWHIEDLRLFKRFLEKAMDGTLEREGHPNYENGVWTPVYPERMEFSDRFKDHPDPTHTSDS